MTPKKLLSALIVAALILVSPGLPFYAQAADIVGPETGARSTPITPIVPEIPIVPQNLDLLKGAQGLPLNGAPVVPAQTPTVNSAATANAATQAAEAARPAQTAQAIQKVLATATAQTAAVNTALNARGGEAAAKTTSDAAFDDAVVRQGETASPVAGSESAGTSDLQSFVPQRGGGSFQPPAPPARGDNGPSNNGPRGSKLVGLATTLLRVAAVGAVVIGLQMGFGLVPEAAVWAVASGVLLLPAGIYARYRLSKRDSPRLTKVKWLLDAGIGAFLGAVVIAAPALGMVLAAQGASLGLKLAVASGGVSALALSTRGSAVNLLAGGAALAGLPLLVGAGAAGALGIAPIVGMMALPAVTTIAFFLGSIINSAETGRPFEVPGSLQKMRFPSFNWIMIGVVFALVTGYSAVYTNLAFMAWMFLGNKQKSAQPSLRDLMAGPKKPWQKALDFVLDFDHLFIGLAAFSALTAFHTPLTFLVLAFAPERAAVWTERLLSRFLPASKAAPSTSQGEADERSLADKLETKVPNFHHWLKTGVILAVMAASVGFGAFTLFGVSAMIKSAIPAAILSALPFFLSRKLVKVVMKAEPTTREKDPEFFDIMDDLRAKINAKRQAAGKKPIPMPEMVNVPMDAPNAFATGPSPFNATVGVTVGIKNMLLDPENVREQLGRLIGAFNARPNDPKYQIFRRAIVGSLKGVSENATPQELAQSIERADPEQLRALGKRMLRGVLGHEFSHVMDRHMLVGSVGGFFSSVFAFASYGIMWGVGHAQVAAKKAIARLFGRPQQDSAPADNASNVSTPGSSRQGAKPEAVEPLSTAVALKSLPALLKVLAALWGPVLLQITQMAGSRNNESQADEDGAKLTEDPESLALALGMLMTWRPRQQFIMFRGRKFEAKDLPLMTAIAPMMTVNPLQQLSDAGALPALDALTQAIVGKADNFLFNLFVTHPDTNLRIETLFRISEGMRAQRKSRDNGGGTTGPPLSFVSPLEKNVPVRSPNRGGSFRGAWARLSSWVRVLPDENRNRQFWKFVWGQALINVGIGFHYSSLGKMADPTGQHPEQVSYNRAVNAGSQMVSSLATGPIIDRTSVQKVMQITYLIRTLFLFAIPLVFFGPHLLWGAAAMMPFLAFQIIIFSAGFAQSAGGTAASVAFNRILAEDTARYNKANAVYNVAVGFAGVVAPLLAGAFIATVSSGLGLAAAGNALSYAVYGALMVATIWLYRTMKLPRDELLQARRDLAKWLKAERKAGRLSVARSVSAGVEKGERVLHIEVNGALSPGEAVPAEFQGYPVRVVAARSAFGELLDGFRAILKSRFLKYYLAFSTIVYMMSDPLVFSVIGGYVKTGLRLGSAAALAHIPLIGSLLVNFTRTPEALFGLYMSAAALGGMVASLLLILMRDSSPDSLDRVAGRFEAAALQQGLDSEQVEHAGAAVRDALPETLAAYRERAEKSADTAAFGRDVLARALHNVNADAFAGKKSPAELEEFARATGLSDDVAAWGRTKEAGRALKTGLPLLERQGKWTAVLHAAGWLLFWAVLGTHSLAASVGAMIVLSILQGPAVAVWSSLVTEALRRNHRQEQGKIYGAMNFYALLFGVAGPFLFGKLLRYAALHPAINVMGISLWIITLMAVLDVWQAWKNFPMETRRRKS